MGGEFAVIGEDLKDKLVAAGFEVVETKLGKYCDVYYFDDSEELQAAVNEYVKI